MPLAMAKFGEANVIQKIGGKDETRRHLACLGFVVGSEVTVIQERGGDIIVGIKDSRVAIDRGVAMRIMV